MAASERLAMLITCNGAQAISEFQKTGVAAERSLKGMEQGTARTSASLLKVGAGMAAFGGVMLVGLYQAAKAAEEENLAVEKLNNSIANSPELAGASADAFLDQAAALQDVTTFADDATISAQAMLATFHLTQDEILGLTPLVADLAAKFDMDLVSASKLVGKAMEGNLGALGRTGIRIDEAAFATDRYSAVLTALRENAGGFAEQEGATFSGQMEILKNNLGDVQEGIGRGAVQAFNSLLGPVMAVSDAFQSLSPGAQETTGKIATFGAVGLVAVGSATMLAGSLLKIKAAYITVKTAAAEAAVAQGAAAGSSAAAGTAMTALGVAAAAAAVGGLAVWANSMNDITLNLEGIGGAADGAAEEVARFLVENDWQSEGEKLEWFRGQAEANLPAAAEFGRLWAEAGGPASEINEILDDVGHSAELAALGLDENATSAEELAARYDALSKSITEYLDVTQGTEEAAAAEAEAQEALFQALVRNGSTFDVNTEAGRENIAARNAWVDAVAGQVQAAITFAEAGGNQEVAQRRANNAIRTGIGDLRRARDAGFITASQFRDLASDIRGIPNNIPISISGAEAAIAQLQRIHQVAQDAAAAVGQIGGSLAGGGAYRPPAGGDGESATRTPAPLRVRPGMRPTARRGSRTRPAPVYVVGGMR